VKALDLFCGLGGWSDGLALEGFEVLGVEIESHIAELYKHPVIVADVRELNGKAFQGYDLIVGSPPCRDFTILPDHALRSDGELWRWKDSKNPERGMELVHAFLRIVEEAKPTYWILENVVGLTEHLDLKPRMLTRLGKDMKRAFWGNFPAFFVVRDYGLKRRIHIHGKLRRWERAKIPVSFSRALGKAVKSALGPTPTPPMSHITNDTAVPPKRMIDLLDDEPDG